MGITIGPRAPVCIPDVTEYQLLAYNLSKFLIYMAIPLMNKTCNSGAPEVVILYNPNNVFAVQIISTNG